MPYLCTCQQNIAGHPHYLWNLEDPEKWLNISVSANTYYVRTVGEFNGADPSDEFGSQTDVFNTATWEVYSHTNIFDLTKISRNKSRMLWLGISYNFNSFKQKSAQKKETDRSLIRLGL